MTTRLRTPFQSLSADNFLSRGSAGQVFAISSSVVFKCATSFDNPTQAHAQEMEESITKLEHEKKIYQLFMGRPDPHPNIVSGILCVPEGLFLHRQETTLESRIEKSSMLAIAPSTQERWIRQITSALVWIEDLGLVHGDLRPANILLDIRENIKLVDFDATVKKGEELMVASEPFCKLDANYAIPLAGPLSEQFSLASCIYNIRFGHKPFHDLEAPARVQNLMKNIFPSTSADTLFGSLTQKCWRGDYESIAAVEQDIFSFLAGHPPCSNDVTVGLHDMLRECHKFLEGEKKTDRLLG